MNKIIGANWKTTVSGIGSTLASLLLGLTLIPYTMPTELSNILSPQWKLRVLMVALIAKTALGTWNALQQKDKNVTGGTTQQTTDGSVASTSSQGKSSAVLETMQSVPKL